MLSRSLAVPLGTHSRQTYRSLSHRFALVCNDAPLARRAATLIGDFSQPLQDGRQAEVVYSLLAACGADGQVSYDLRRGDRQLAESHDSDVVVGQLLWQISGDTVELAEGFLLIHAGAVVSPGGEGVLVLGESGSGKTTLVAALVQEGFGFLSDEAGAIEIDTGLAHPWPRPLGFKRGARSLKRFSELFAPEPPGVADETHVGVNRIRPGAIAAPCSVRHVIDYCYSPDAETRVEPLSRASALARLGSAAPRLRREGARGLRALAELMRGASGYRLVSGDLERGIGAVRALVDR